MKILQINVLCKKGSTGKIVYDLYTVINSNGHEAAICYGRGKAINEANIYKFGLDIETYIHALLTRITGLTGIFSPFSTRRLIKYIKKFKPDVVHIHELHAYFVNIAPVIRYLRERNIRTIWTFHCEFMYTGKCGYAYDCDKWKSQCGKCPQVKAYPSSWFFDFTKKMFNWKKELFKNYNNLVIVTPSQWLRNRLRESFLVNNEIYVIRNGIDTSIFYPRDTNHIREKHNLKDEKVILGVVSSISDERKGGKWVLKLAEKFIGQKVKFVLIGVKDKEYDLPSNVIALPYMNDQNELAEYYSAADIFVICSKKENFPTTCIEALCCGTPVVGFDEGGTKETAPGKFGTFVKYGDIENLYNIIYSMLFKNTDIPTTEECACFGKTNYDKSVMSNKYLRLYINEKI